MSTPIAAFNLVAGTSYRILSIGTTDFTLIGAASNTVDIVFVATGPGTGTGTVVLASAIPEFTEPSVENFLSDGDSYYTRDKLIVWDQDLGKWVEENIPA